MTLDECRTAINQLDDQILDLFLRRMEVAEEVARQKRLENLPIFHPDREKSIRERLAKRAPLHMVPYVNRLYDTVFTLSRDRQCQLNEEQNTTLNSTTEP